MADLLSSVAAPSTDRKRKSSPEMPSSEGMEPEPSSEGSFFGSRKRYGEEEDDEALVWNGLNVKSKTGKKPRRSDMTVTQDEYNGDMDVDMGEDEDIQVKPEPMEVEDEEEMAIKAKPLAPSSKPNTIPKRRVVNSTSVKVQPPKPEIPISSLKVETPTRAPTSPRSPNGSAKPITAHWSSVSESLVPKTSEIESVAAPSGSGSVKSDNVLEEDGSLKIFWLDFQEQGGVIHLIGKVLDRASGKFVSACLSVSGIQRNLFVKPRKKRFCELSCSDLL
jgi:DNA polymerase alpha subunit A